MYHILAQGWQKHPWNGRGQGHMTHFQFRCPQSYLQNGWSESPNFVCRLNVSNASLVMTDYPLMGVVRVMYPVFINFAPIISLESVKLGTSNVVCWLIQRCTSTWMTDYPDWNVFRVTWPLGISDNISETVQDRDKVAMSLIENLPWLSNGTTASALDGHFWCLKPFNFYNLWNSTNLLTYSTSRGSSAVAELLLISCGWL